MMKLLIILILFSLNSTAQTVRIKAVKTLTTKPAVTVNTPTGTTSIKGVSTATTEYVYLSAKSFGLDKTQDSLKRAYRIIDSLIAVLRSDSTVFSKRDFKGKGTETEPLEIVKE